ncbi:MAG TPA: hypothetical protein VN724_17900 [Pyrinomonadaceae bacterium]|jgi:hypothetical protein|nr:hypothetical protein [Pyrinomonadaceae bacterium]
MSKPTEQDAENIAHAARQMLAAGSVGDEPLRSSASVGRAIPVRGSNRELHSWFVPLTVGDRLAAFFQFLPDRTLMRFSSFQRRPGDCAGCPAVTDWLDAEQIRKRAATQLQAGETIGEPFLSYDRSPDRLVWAVPLSHERDERLVYVVGDTVYSPPSGDTFG